MVQLYEKLRTVKISPQNKNFLASENDDFIFGKINHSKSEEFDILLFARRDIEHVVIPSFIKCIGAHAFSECTQIKSFEFEEDSKLESINECAFANSSIKSIKFPQNLNQLNKGWRQNLNKLRRISIDPNNQNFSMINNDKFLVGKSDKNSRTFDVLLYANRDTQKVVIPKNIKYIGPFAFYNCLKLKSVTFPVNSVLVSIGENAFGQTSIEKVSFPSKLEEIGDFAFENCRQLETIEFPGDSMIHTIGKGSFINSMIDNIFIPKSVKTIGSFSFCLCNYLKSVEFEESSELKKIDEKAFQSTRLESIKIPESLIEFGNECFSYCGNLKYIEFPLNSNLKKIGKHAFSYTAIENITIPSSVEIIEEAAFCLCSSLKSIIFSEDSELKSFENDIFYETLIENISIPPKVTECKNDWCAYTFELKSFNIINNDRFKFVDDKFLVYKSDEKSDTYDNLICARRDIKNAIVPSYIQRICSNSFSHCNELLTVRFPEDSKLKVIEKESFAFSSVELISLPSTVEQICESAFFECQNLTTIENFENLQIRMIEKLTFFSTSIESLSIPEKVVELKENWCDGIPSNLKITVSPKNPYFSIINDSFIVSKTDKNSNIYDVLLFSRRDIEHVIIPSFIKIISQNAFNECNNLKTFEFEKNSKLISIGKTSFIHSFIRKIVIPSSVKEIGDFAFCDCHLESIEFEKNSELKSIKNNAFSINSLKNATIPSKVSVIGHNVFNDNINLNCVDFLCENVTLEHELFDNSSLLLLAFPNAKKITNFRIFLFGCQGKVTIFVPFNAILE